MRWLWFAILFVVACEIVLRCKKYSRYKIKHEVEYITSELVRRYYNKLSESASSKEEKERVHDEHLDCKAQYKIWLDSHNLAWCKKHYVNELHKHDPVHEPSELSAFDLASFAISATEYGDKVMNSGLTKFNENDAIRIEAKSCFWAIVSTFMDV